jgi:tripartite-type tricarboxylate transporter receptor subunit TctC
MALLWLQAAIAGFCAAVLLTGTISDAHAADPFYKGKRITLLINFAAGGPTDIEGRLFAKYLVKHIEGEPSIIVQGRPGARSASSTIAGVAEFIGLPVVSAPVSTNC